MVLLQDAAYCRKKARKLRLAAARPLAVRNRDTLKYFAADLEEMAEAAEAAKPQHRFPPTRAAAKRRALEH